MDDFHPVSIKMAKEQNLSLSPTKISGLCGRLMCCLQYEQASYESMRKKMPRVGRPILTADGQGVVMENNVLTEKTRVRLEAADGTVDIRDYPYEQLASVGQPLPKGARPLAADKGSDAGERLAASSRQRQGRPAQPRQGGGKSAEPGQKEPQAKPAAVNQPSEKTEAKPAQSGRPRRRSYGRRRRGPR